MASDVAELSVASSDPVVTLGRWNEAAGLLPGAAYGKSWDKCLDREQGAFRRRLAEWRDRRQDWMDGRA